MESKVSFNVTKRYVPTNSQLNRDQHEWRRLLSRSESAPHVIEYSHKSMNVIRKTWLYSFLKELSKRSNIYGGVALLCFV